MSQIRFIEASGEALQILGEVRAKYFPELSKAIIKVLFDTKKRMHGPKIVLGRILKANDLVRRLTDDLAESGCDYVMFLDQVAFENIALADKIRLIRHELRHCKVIIKDEDDPPKYKVIPHDIEDFIAEVEFNKDDVGWASRAAALAGEIYEQRKEMEAEEKGAETPAPPKEEEAPATPPVRRRIPIKR